MKKVTNLVGKLVLGASIVGNTLIPSTSNQAQAQTLEHAHIYSHILLDNSHHLYHHDPKLARDLHTLGHVVHGLSHLAATLPDNSGYSRGPRHLGNQRNHRQPVRTIQPTVNLYVYTDFEDGKGNGIINRYADHSDELIGSNNPSFWEDDTVRIGIRTKGLRGRKASYKLNTPDGKTIFSNSVIIPKNDYFYEFANFYQGLQNTLKNHGQGVYSAILCINNQHIATRKFGLKSNKRSTIEQKTEEILAPLPHREGERIDGYILDGRFYPAESKGSEEILAPAPLPVPKGLEDLNHSPNDYSRIEGDYLLPNPNPLTRSQEKQIERFEQLIIQRKRKMQRKNSRTIVDPFGYDWSNNQILQLNGDFSIENMDRVWKSNNQ